MPLAPEDVAHQLVTQALLSPRQQQSIQHAADKTGTDFVSQLIHDRSVPAQPLLHLLVALSDMPAFDLQALAEQAMPAVGDDPQLIQKHGILPMFQQAGILFAGLANPCDDTGLAALRRAQAGPVEPVLVAYDQLAHHIHTRFNALESAVSSLTADPPVTDVNQGEPTSQDRSVVAFIDQVLEDAATRGASDIHFEPYEHHYRIRMRHDGILQEVAAPPVDLGRRLAARLKVMAELNLAERRLPQDGRLKLPLTRATIDLRVSTCPTLYGEKVVLRLLDPDQTQLDIAALGYDAEQRRLFEQTLHKPHGMILVTGPTGSGKTVSLYAALNRLNTAGRNISTVEDPAEINLPGINQVSIAPRIGLDFATCLRAFLRQDPDVIMVGEIRDLETAEIAIQAAQTGHMVLSTLHTNDAPATLTRLQDMGIPAYNIAASVSLIIAQRLARRLCRHCRQPASIPEPALVAEGFVRGEISQLTLFEANADGCLECSDGHRGRVGLFQVMPVSGAMARLIMAGGHADDLARQAREEGILTLRQAGLDQVRSGLISLSELNRVTLDQH